MKQFTELFSAIDGTTKTNQKIEALLQYFQQAEEKDTLYAIALLTGNKPKRPVKTSSLKEWCAEMAGIPDWLFNDAYFTVGDLAETITLLLSKNNSSWDKSLTEVLQLLRQIAVLPEEEKKVQILSIWQQLNGTALFVFNKLITGNFRVGVSKQLVIKALAKFLQKEETLIAHQLMGKWNPEKESINTLFHEEAISQKTYQPYPFFLAYPLETPIESLGAINKWIIEPKLDGIRGQLIFRDKQLYLWSRGEDLLTDKFPEFEQLIPYLPENIVMDGEIIPFKDEEFLNFHQLQTRIGRKNITKKILQDVPVVMVCFDLLEYNGIDIRSHPLHERRKLLAETISSIPLPVLKLSQNLTFTKWEEVSHYRDNARQFNTEGVMLKQLESEYLSGRKRAGWWKWKTNPMTIDGVLLYAQSGHGRRANLFTDYTFAVWDTEKNLLPFTKAYSGLTDKEIIRLDQWIKRNTIQKFGPVRSVTPFHVFEIAFEGIAYSGRHKSGVALRFPRIHRWRTDKKPADANTIDDLKKMIN